MPLQDAHRALRDVARRFAEREIAPHASEWDRDERFPSELIPRLASLGFLGICVPEQYGGAGLDTLAYATIVEELSRADGSIGLTVASHNGLGSAHLARFGSDELKARFMPRLARGECLGAWALTEPNSGSDAAALQTRAVRDGDGWVLNGTKMFITQGSVGGLVVVLASTDPAAGARGITAFAVEMPAAGLTAQKLTGKHGVRASDTAELHFEDVRVPDSMRIGALGSGFTDAKQVLAKGRVSIAAMALGLGEGALQAAVDYAKQREQFGKALSEFQALRFMLADARTELDAARLLVWRAADLLDAGEPAVAEAAMAKLFASEAATRVCDNALQIHGGYGYLGAFPVSRHARDVRVTRIGEGTSEVQRSIIAKSLLG